MKCHVLSCDVMFGRRLAPLHRPRRISAVRILHGVTPSCFVPFGPPPACLRRVPVSRVSRAGAGARRRRRGSRAFRNGAFPVKHVFSTPNAAHRFPARGPEGRSGKPVRWGLEPQRRGLVVVVGSGRTPVRRSPYRCPPPGSRFRPWSARRPPTSCLVQCGSRVPIR